MNKFFLAAAVLAAATVPAAAATQITVEDIGSILNQSLALPAESTPGSGIGFEQFFEFSLPTKEIVTLSVSDSGIGAQRIVGGVLGLNFFTSEAPVSPFQPMGALIDSTPILNGIGGQEATLEPNVLNAGAYFAEVSGVSGSSPIHLAIDGTVTAVATPELSTWAMLLLGGAFMAWGAMRRRVSSTMVDSLT
jgi:hypothetical protein